MGALYRNTHLDSKIAFVPLMGALEVADGDPAGALTIRLGHSMDALYWGTHLNSKIASVPYKGPWRF